MDTLNGLRPLTLPIAYSPADLRTRGLLLEALRKVESEYRAVAQPFLNALAEIDAAYPIRTALVPVEEP